MSIGFVGKEMYASADVLRLSGYRFRHSQCYLKIW